jgi:hypothetical protein
LAVTGARPLKLTIRQLLQEVQELEGSLRRLRRCYPHSPATLHPFSTNWKPIDQSKCSKDIVEMDKWTKSVGIHVKNLTRYYVNWRDRPDDLGRFPLYRCVTVYKGCEPVTWERCLSYLGEHRELLLIERTQCEGNETDIDLRGSVTRDNLSEMMKAARRRFGQTQENAAVHTNVELERWKSWEHGRNFPHPANLKEVEKYIREAAEQEV